MNGTGSTSGGTPGTGGSHVGTTGTGGAPGSGGVNGGGSGSSSGSGGAAASGSGGSSGTDGTGGSAMGVPGSLDLSGSPKYYRVIRLSNAQWAAAVKTVLNVSSGGVEQNFEGSVSGTTDFTNNELVLDFDSRNWQDYQSAAEALATQVTASTTALSKVYSGTDAAGLITAVGRRAYRRALTTAEQSAYMTLYTTGAAVTTGTGTAFTKGAYLVISAMLQSPNFLFRTELGAKGAPLSAYEMAAKLALLLRGTGPDDKTLDLAAGTGKLDTADGAAALAQTMLGEAGTVTVMRQFHGEWLGLDDYAQVSKSGIPAFTAALPAEFQESSYRFFDNILSQGLGIQDILTSTSGYYGPAMAKLYGVTAPSSGFASGDLGAKRVGFFSQLPYLTLNGINDQQNSILRGVELNRSIVCATLGPPAANIPPVPALVPGQTNRQRITTLTGSCGMTCHNNMINPLGFAFEHFDGMGQYMDTENGGLTIDSSGSYTFADGTTKTWTDAAGLMQVLAATPQTYTCFSKKLASFALQRDVVASDMPMLNTLTSASMTAGTNSEKQLILQLVRNDAFRTHGGPQ